MLDKTREYGRLRVAADIGGTFTDVAVFDEERKTIALGKVLSTPDRLVDGVVTGLARAEMPLDEAGIFFHGSTVAINTLLERTGARTALITTEGFADIYEIGRINRPDSFNLFFRKHQPLVERRLRFEVRERLYADGTVRTPLDMDSVAAVADRLARLDVEAVAILFLHSYRNPAHEEQVKDYLVDRFPQMFVTASHELSQEYREFERTSTTVANAFIGHRVRTYLGELEEQLRRDDFGGSLFVVKSSGGVYSAEEARSRCIWMLESGPAAGIVGAKALCDDAGLGDAIAFDMGGTTAKAGVIKDHKVLTTGTAMIGGYAEGLPVQVAMIDITEVGTGGGSIARVGPGGSLRVGPQSAGAVPGPACYGRGGDQPTVTDANLLLGRLGADRFLGGEMALDVEAARLAMEQKVCEPLGIDLIEAAEGVLRIAVTAMAHGVKSVTSERGLDPGSFGVLVAYGGAGPLHAVAVARELGIGSVVVPFAPGHFAACGMLQTDLRHDFVRSLFAKLDNMPFDEIAAHFEAMEEEGVRLVRQSLTTVERVATERAVDMRYVGQEHAATIQLPAKLFESQDRDAIRTLFDATHERLYGHASPDEPAEVVSLRSSVQGILAKPQMARLREGGEAPPAEAMTGKRPVHFLSLGAFIECPVYGRSALLAGNRIAGPALIEEHASTTVLHPGYRLEVDAFGNLIITVGA